jgi:hypothetical protein
MPAVVSRRDWGAASCKPRRAPDYGSVKAIHVHHTVSLNDYSAEEAPSIVLAICRYHRNSNGWNDIGYNALVDKFGTLYEGRAGGLGRAVVGAHAQGFNSQAAGIANIGDHSSLPQTPAALQAMARYIRWKLPLHGAPTGGPVTLVSAGGPSSRYPAGREVVSERVLGHRDTGRTACPGGALYAQLGELRRLTGSLLPAFGAQTRLTASLDSTLAPYRGVVRLHGALAAADGRPLGGEPVQLEVRRKLGWERVRGWLTDPDGSFAAELRPHASRLVRVRYLGRAELLPSASPGVLLKVRALVLLAPTPMRAARGSRLVLRGSVAPSKRLVHVVVQQRRGGRWRRLMTLAAGTRAGRYRSSFLVRDNGTLRFYVVAKADSVSQRGRSEIRLVRVGRSSGGAPARR